MAIDKRNCAEGLCFDEIGYWSEIKLDIVKEVVAAFTDRLKSVAGFKYVPEPLPMRNSTNAVVYYLFFASHQPVASKIVQDIVKKYENRRV